MTHWKRDAEALGIEVPVDDRGRLPRNFTHFTRQKERLDINLLAEHGFTFRCPASRDSIFTREAAESLIGTFTELNAKEFNIEQTWRMEIVAAKVVDDGQALELTLHPPHYS